MCVGDMLRNRQNIEKEREKDDGVDDDDCLDDDDEDEVI